MKENQYLNKALNEAAKIMKIVEAQKKTLDSIIPNIEGELKKQGADMTIIEEMKKAAESKDLQKLKELSQKIKR